MVFHVGDWFVHPCNDQFYKKNVHATVFTLNQDYWLNDTGVVDMDARACTISKTSEESDRQREEGWFLLRALHTAQVSYDLSHIPSSMVSLL